MKVSVDGTRVGASIIRWDPSDIKCVVVKPAGQYNMKTAHVGKVRHICIRMCVQERAGIYVYVCVCRNGKACMYMYVCAGKLRHICMWVYVKMYLCMYIHIIDTLTYQCVCICVLRSKVLL